jgi:hypothetical protein
MISRRRKKGGGELNPAQPGTITDREVEWASSLSD